MNAILQFGAGYRTYIIAAVLVLVVVVEKGLGIDVPGVDVGSDWLTQILAAGRKAGAATEAAKAREAELKSQKEASDAKDRMLEAGAAAPRDRDALADRLRDGTF